jgi:Leucine-rich repeat (LRR) protein
MFSKLQYYCSCFKNQMKLSTLSIAYIVLLPAAIGLVYILYSIVPIPFQTTTLTDREAQANLLAEIAAAAASGARELDLSGRGIRTLPIQIGTLIALEKLNLAHNPLSALPDEFQNCVRLHTIFFLGNSFTGIQLVCQRRDTHISLDVGV